MVRLYILVEGQTEETFVNQTLAPYLGKLGVYTTAQLLCHKKIRLRKYAGGIRKYKVVKDDLSRMIHEHRREDVWFTTMVDLYALPDDFPDFNYASQAANPHDRVKRLEQAIAIDFKNDLNFERLIPYIQLHEFEALLFADPQKFDWEFIEDDQQQAIHNLIAIQQEINEPELINDSPETAPSKRIIKEIPVYDGMKASAGPAIAKKIGLPTLREKCPHFDEWLTCLENLNEIS